MNTRRKFLAGLGAVLLLATGAVAQSTPTRTAVPTPTQVVQQYLAARAAHDSARAYGFLSAGTRQQLPFAQFTRKTNFSEYAAHAGAAGVSPTMLAFDDMFMDLQGELGYRFSVVGPAPGDPRTILVRALPLHGATPTGCLLKIVMTAAAATGGIPRIDVFASFPKTAPLGTARAREQARRITSISNLRQIALAVLQYAADHHEHFPKADRWVDEILPYTQTARIFLDPSARQGQYNYAFNRNLSALPFVKVVRPAELVMVFESTRGFKNASDTGQSVPRPGRHIGGTDYAFADGHVKWRPDGTRLSYLPGASVAP